jgi:hypothetical protein
VTGGKAGKGKKVTEKYLPNDEWDALSADAKPTPIKSWKKGDSEKSDKSISSAKTANTIKSLSKTTTKLKKLVRAHQKCDKDDDDDSSISTVEKEGSNHLQDALEMVEEHHPKIVLALKHKESQELDLQNVLLLDKESTFDLCCNKSFTSKIVVAKNALKMRSNGGNLKITKTCKIPG